MESNEEISEKLDVVLRTLKTAKEEREIFEKHVIYEINVIKSTLSRLRVHVDQLKK